MSRCVVVDCTSSSMSTSTAEKIDSLKARYTKGYSLRYGYGRVNADAAVAAAQARRRRGAARKKR